MANRILPGYSTPMGDKILIHLDHDGPSSYTRVTVGTTPTGADIINASDIGVGGFDNLDGMTDSTGRFYILAIPIGGGGGNAVTQIMLVWFSLVTATVGGQSQTANTEVAAGTNLSAFSVRVQAICV